jgi:hypothetical protein
MIKRMGEIRKVLLGDAYNKGGADLEAAKLQFASLLFYRRHLSNVNRYQTECSIRYIPSPSRFRGQQRRGIAVAIMGGDIVRRGQPVSPGSGGASPYLLGACRKETTFTLDLDRGSIGIRQPRSSIHRLALTPIRPYVPHADTPSTRKTAG